MGGKGHDYLVKPIQKGLLAWLFFAIFKLPLLFLVTSDGRFSSLENGSGIGYNGFCLANWNAAYHWRAPIYMQQGYAWLAPPQVKERLTKILNCLIVTEMLLTRS